MKLEIRSRDEWSLQVPEDQLTEPDADRAKTRAGIGAWRTARRRDGGGRGVRLALGPRREGNRGGKRPEDSEKPAHEPHDPEIMSLMTDAR